jgi:hypothetical protein
VLIPDSNSRKSEEWENNMLPDIRANKRRYYIPGSKGVAQQLDTWHRQLQNIGSLI